MESELVSSQQQFPTVKVYFTILWKKEVKIILPSQMYLSGSVQYLCSVSNVDICLLFVSVLESVYFIPGRLRNTELQIHETVFFHSFLHLHQESL